MKTPMLLFLSLVLLACEPADDGPAELPGRPAVDDRDAMLQQIADAAELLNALEDTLNQETGNIIDLTTENDYSLTQGENLQRKLNIVMNRLDGYRDSLAEQLRKNRELLQGSKESRNSNYARTIKSLENVLKQKDKQIRELHNQLSDAKSRLQQALDARIVAESALAQEREEKLAALRRESEARQGEEQALADRSQALDSLQKERRAWFVADTREGLEERGFAWVNESFLSFGGHLAPGSSMNRQQVFGMIDDITSWSEYTADGNIERIHSGHAEVDNAYRIEENRLIITNWARFWSAGKYLTIEIED